MKILPYIYPQWKAMCEYKKKAIHSKQQDSSNSANIGESCENFKLMGGLANEQPTIEHNLPQLAAPWFVGVPPAVVLAPS